MATRDSTTEESLDRNSNRATLLEDIIEEERTRLMLARNVLGCTAVAINNDRVVDQSPFVYGDVIELTREMIDETTNRLDSAYLQEFYDQLERAQREFHIEGDRYHGMTIKVAGHTRPLLTVNTGICECGDIKDGISLAHHDETSPEDWIQKSDGGGWVMAWADLEAIYQSALAKRARKSMQDIPNEGDAAGTAPVEAHAMQVGGGL